MASNEFRIFTYILEWKYLITLTCEVLLKRVVTIAGLLLMCWQPVLAAHLKGGYIEYQYLGPTPNNPKNGHFRITVYQYLDCSSAGGQIDDEVYLGVFDAVTNALVFTDFIPLSGTKFIQKGSFPCIINPPEVCFRIDSYTTETDISINANGYILSVQRCCRIAGIQNIANSSNTGVTYSAKILANQAGNGFLDNDSPVFAQQDTALVCAGSYFTFPFNATDPDNDSLVFHFTAGLNTPTREAKPLPPYDPPYPALVYAGVFNAEQPMGSNVQIDVNTGVISGVAPSKPGDYVVAVLVEEYRQGAKIAESRKELHIKVGNCDIPKAVLPANIINCKSFDVAFENQSTSAGISSYSWDFGVPNRTDDISSSPQPVYTYPDTGVYKAKLVVNRGGACPDSAFAEVKIFPVFVSAFAINGVCRQLPYLFKDQSHADYGSIRDWHWDFGDETILTDTSNLQNPVYNYDVPGAYTVKLRVNSTKGCADSTSVVLQVADRPVINLAFKDTLICSIDTLQLRAIGPGNYSWSPGTNIINANSSSPLVFPKDTITYYVSVNNNGCEGRDSVKVNVLDFIKVDAGNDTTICRGDATALHAVSFGTRYSWTPAATLNNATAKEPLATPADAVTEYKVLASLGKCTATDKIKITTVPYPLVNAGKDTTVCFEKPVMLHGSSNGSSYRWSPANVVEHATSLSTKAFPHNSTQFILSATDTLGCPKPATDSVMVSMLPKIVVNAGNDTSAVIDQQLQLHGISNAQFYHWSPATAMNNSEIANPVINVTGDLLSSGLDFINYTLTASTLEGCNAKDDIKVYLFKTGPSIFMPSAFTPNRDGLNDEIRPLLAGMRRLDYFRIYNRYGQLVFETRQVGKGWDGTINGQLQSSGIFVYDCHATDYMGMPKISKGSFLLVR